MSEVLDPKKSAPAEMRPAILPDPAGQDVASVRPIRDDIEQRVRTLLAELEVPARS